MSAVVGPCQRRVIVGRASSAPLLIDDVPRNAVSWGGGIVLQDIWSSTAMPPSYEPVYGGTDLRESVPPSGTRWMMVEFPASDGQEATSTPIMHATKSIDYVTVVTGSVDLILEGESITLTHGDCLVQLGETHAWVNRTSDPCVVSVVMLGTDAPPVSVTHS